MNGGFSLMYVYTDIVDAQFVGDGKVPLLTIVNTQGNYGDNVNASLRYMQYVPIKVKSFKTIEINIKDDKNENVSFAFGKSIATLHFKQQISIFHLKMRHTVICYLHGQQGGSIAGFRGARIQNGMVLGIFSKVLHALQFFW